MKQILDSGHISLAGIAEIDANLFKTEYFYLSNNYATDGKATKNKLKSFVDGFTGPFNKLSGFVNSVSGDCDAMLKLSEEFAKENNLLSRPKIGSKGCEADLATLQCELFDLLRELKAQRENILEAIKVMQSTLSTLSGKVKDFASVVARGGNDKDCCGLLPAANRFFVEFNQRHWVGYKKFVEVQFICDEITVSVSIFDVKLQCDK